MKNNIFAANEKKERGQMYIFVLGPHEDKKKKKLKGEKLISDSL